MAITSGTELDEEITRVLDRVLERASALAQAAVDTFLGDIEPYGRAANAELIAEVSAHVEQHMSTFLRVARDRRPVLRDDLRFVREPIVHRAQQGFPLDAVLHALRLGHLQIWEAIREEAGDRPIGRDAVIEITPRSFEYIDMAGTEMTRVYMAEQARAARVADVERRDVLENLLLGVVPPPVSQLGVAVNGLTDDGGVVVVLASPAESSTADSGSLRTAADQLAHELRHIRPEPFVVVRQQEVVGLLAVQGDGVSALSKRIRHVHSAVQTRTDSTWAFAVSSVLASLVEVPRGYREAANARLLAGGFVAVPEMSPFEYLVASDDGSARNFAAAEIERLAQADAKTNGALLQTIVAYTDANLNVTRAAAKLAIHPNTLHYRLGRIGEATGRDLRSFSDLMDLVTLFRLVGDGTPRDPA
jgi:hypothetical protein